MTTNPHPSEQRLAEANRLERENSALRIGWWNDMRKRGVSQDLAIQTIREALSNKDQ